MEAVVLLTTTASGDEQASAQLCRVEIDEVAPYLEGTKSQPSKGLARLRRLPELEPTIVFVHGYALNLDCWHFQRAAYRGLVRAVYYDQRSHGRSGRSPDGHATIEQLGEDLRTVLDHVVPEGPIVLVGHSMGGMSIVALAEQHPELIGDRVVGVGLISTTAGGLDPSRLLLPMLPAKLGGELTQLLREDFPTDGTALDPGDTDLVLLLGSHHGVVDAGREDVA